jgi:hypothetical protein
LRDDGGGRIKDLEMGKMSTSYGVVGDDMIVGLERYSVVSSTLNV